MHHRNRRTSIIVASLFAFSVGLVACGGSDGSGNAEEDLGPTSNGKFDYEPGEPGVSAGLTARADLDSREDPLVSNEAELELRAPGNTTVNQSLAADGDSQTGRLTFGTASQGLSADTLAPSDSPDEWGAAIGKKFTDAQSEIRNKYDEVLSDSAAAKTAGTDVSNDPDTIAQAQSCQGLPHARATREMGTWDGWTCSNEWTAAVGGGGRQTTYAWVMHYAPEGGYFTLQKGEAIYFPPDIANASKTTSLTCVKTPNRGNATVDFFNSTQSVDLSVDLSIGPLDVSFTYGVVVAGSQGPVGFSVGYGVGISSSFFMGPFSLPFGFSVGGAEIETLKNDGNPGYFVYSGPREPCSPSGNTSQQGLETDNPLTGISNLIADQSEPPTSRREATFQASMNNVAPLYSVLGNTTGTGPAQHIPAATNADTFADFFSRDNTCSSCPDTSLAYINERIDNNWNDAGSNDERARLGAAAASKAREALPQLGLQQQLQKRARQSVGLTQESILSEAGENDYYSPDIVNLTAPLGESVTFEITAQEIADLVGASPADIDGAEVCLEESLNIEADPLCQTMENGSVSGSFTPSSTNPLTLIPNVDLTSAAGSFGGADVSEWDVRPAIRIFTPVPNENAELSLVLDGPSSIVSGGAASLNAMLVDENGVPADLDGTVELLDIDGDVVATGDLQYGTATLQFQPTPTTPVVDAVEATEFELTDGSTADGYLIRGEGISRLGTIRIDGNPIVTDPDADPDAGNRFGTSYGGNSRVALIPREMSDFLDAGDHTIVIEHPGGATSEPHTFTLQ